MQIRLTSVLVDDQEKALRFYTDVLGFEKKHDFPAGGGRWLTVTSPEGLEGMELLLEPNGIPVAQTYQRALYEQGIPATMFFSTDIQAEYERLKERGVVFAGPPQKTESGTMAVFDDTCGNLILLHEV